MGHYALELLILAVSLANLVLDRQQHRDTQTQPRPPFGPIR